MQEKLADRIADLEVAAERGDPDLCCPACGLAAEELRDLLEASGVDLEDEEVTPDE